MHKIIALGLVIILLSLGGCITTIDGYQRPKPKADSVRAKSYFDLGVAYIQKGRYDLAEPKLRNSIQIKPTAQAYNALAVLYEEQHENALAEEIYQRLLADFPTYELGYINYYVFLCKNNRQNQMDRVANTMQSKGKTWAALGQIVAGNCALEKGNKGRAATYYRRALQFEPYSAGALLPLAKINYDKGLVEKAKGQVDLVNNHVGYTAKSVYLAVLINRKLGNRLKERHFLQILRTRFADSEEAQKLSGN